MVPVALSRHFYHLKTFITDSTHPPRTSFHSLYILSTMLKLVAIITFLAGHAAGGAIRASQNHACVFKPNQLGNPLALSGDSGEVLSYNYGVSNYENNLNCAWKISITDTSEIIRLKFIDFDVEASSSTCAYDSLRVYDGGDASAPRIANLCGDDLPADVFSSGHELYLVFTTDNSITERGFKIEWTSEDKSAFTVPPYECDCGRPSIPHKEGNGRGMLLPDGRVVGGQEAEPGSWPWQVELKLTSFGHYCGGSLIHPQWLITAAHCMTYTESRYTFHVGKHNKFSTDPTEQTYTAAKIYRHANYDSSSLDNDIALVKLTTPVEINERVDVVCIPPQGYEAPDGDVCYTTGWGSTSGTGNDNVLKQALVPHISRTRCLTSYPGEITVNMVCAGYPEGGHDACQGDSGGPLHCKNAAGEWEVIGITSWGYGCAQPNRPGVYTRVASYPAWIERQMSLPS